MSSELGEAAQAVASECVRRGCGEVAIVIFARRDGPSLRVWRVASGVAGAGRTVTNAEAVQILEWAKQDVRE